MKLNKNFFALIGIGLIILIVLGLFAYFYIAPFGAQVVYQFTSSNKDKISVIKGAQSSENINNNATSTLIIPEQTIRQNIVTFNLKLLSNNIQGIWVNLKFKGDPKELKIGVKGELKGKYIYQPLYNKLLEDLSGEQINNGILFWQKGKEFNSFADFTKNPPTDKLTATYFFDPLEIYSYQPASAIVGEFSSNKLLRGTHELLIRVDQSPLEIDVKKQDQNMYKGPDVLSVEVYKEDTLLATKVIPDDGIVDATNLMLQPQDAKLELKDIEPGIYRLLLSDKSIGSDVRISSIEINQKNVVFNSPIFIVDSKPTSLFTNASQVSVSTAHLAGLQTLKINGNKDFEIAKKGEVYNIDLINATQNQKQASKSANLNQTLSEIDIPKNDLGIKGDGYFTFDKNSFFNTEPLNSIDLTGLTDTGSIDYVIARYQKVQKDGDWNVAQVYFDPKDINVDGNKLYFSLESPGLSQSQGEIAIGSLEVTVNKPGWFNNPSNGGAGEQEIISNTLAPIATVTKESEGFLTKIINFFKNLWPFKSVISNQQPVISKTPKATNSPTPTPIPIPTPILTLKDTVIVTIQNGGGAIGIATKYSDLFKKAGFKNVQAENVSLASKEATISVNKDEKTELESTVTEIETIISPDYGIVNRIITADKNNIIVILGAIPTPTPTPTVSPSAH